MSKEPEKRRRFVKTLGLSVPAYWSLPVVHSVMLPAHAQTSPDEDDDDGGGGTPSGCGTNCIERFSCNGDSVICPTSDPNGCIDNIHFDFDGANCNTRTSDGSGNVVFDDTLLTIDSDPNDPTWFDGGTGENWQRQQLSNENQPGEYCQSVVYNPTGDLYEFGYRVEVSLANNGDVTMTLSNLTLCLVGTKPGP